MYVQVNAVLEGALLPDFHRLLKQKLLPWAAECFPHLVVEGAGAGQSSA